MAKELHVEVVAVEEMVFSGEAEMVIARTTDGELAALPGHAPLLGQLAEPGQVRIKLANGQMQAYDVTGGFLSITESGVTVLAESVSVAATPAKH